MPLCGNYVEVESLHAYMVITIRTFPEHRQLWLLASPVKQTSFQRESNSGFLDSRIPRSLSHWLTFRVTISHIAKLSSRPICEVEDSHHFILFIPGGAVRIILSRPSPSTESGPESHWFYNQLCQFQFNVHDVARRRGQFTGQLSPLMLVSKATTL